MARRKRNVAVASLTKEGREGYQHLLAQDASGAIAPFTVVGVTAILKKFFKDPKLAIKVYRELVAHRLVTAGERVGKQKEFTVLPSKVKEGAESKPTRRRRRRRGRPGTTAAARPPRARRAPRVPAELTFDDAMALLLEYNAKRQELHAIIERLERAGIISQGKDGGLIIRFPK